MKPRQAANRTLRLAVPSSGFSALQLHVLDQLTHCAVVRHGLATRNAGLSRIAASPLGPRLAASFMENVLGARYRDCMQQGVEEAADAIIEYVGSAPESATNAP